VRPIYTELNRFMYPVGIAFIQIKKTIDIKLPAPYSSCERVISAARSHLVKQILEQHLTYRKVYCYDLCISEYASQRNISKYDAYWKINFNYTGNCSRFCPCECETTIFDISETNLPLLVDSSVRSVYEVNFHFLNNKYTELTQVVKTTEADLISSTGGVLGLFLDLSFYQAFCFLGYILDLVIA
jgi:hypothetical protein